MTTDKTVRPRNSRVNYLSALRFQERDGAVLQAIYRYDGVLARRQLKEMFWPDKTWRAMEMRLSRLYQHSYLDWPNAKQRQTRPIPEPICWLGWEGVLWLAGEGGFQIEQPKSANETQLRLLERRLREVGIHWLREPRWSQLKHDLSIVDIRLAVEKAVRELPFLTLENWIPESVFHSHMDIVEYRMTGQDGHIRLIKKGVRPDGFFVIVDRRRLEQSLPARARFLLELDMATHDNPSFGREKVIPGLAYLKSAAYKARFGANAGRWLVVTTSQLRLKHLIKQTRVTGSKNTNVFLFSTFEKVASANTLLSPIWQQVGDKELISLVN
jgi:hypothetical protein